MDAALDLDAERRRGTGGSSSTNVETDDDTRAWECVIMPGKETAKSCHDFMAKACGYHDGRAVSPRSLGYTSPIVGSNRVTLFYTDNTEALTHEQQQSDGDIYDDSSPIRILDLKAAGLHAVVFPAATEFAIEAKSFWQHTGEIVSSRRAEVALVELGIWNTDDDKPSDDTLITADEPTAAGGEHQHMARITSSFYYPATANKWWIQCPYSKQPHVRLHPAKQQQPPQCPEQPPIQTPCPYNGIKKRIASITNTPPSSVFLTPSGMSTIYTALRSARRRKISQQQDDDSHPSSSTTTTTTTSSSNSGGTSIVYGFPYLDTLKLCSRPELVPGGVEFFGHGRANDLSNLETMLETRKNENADGYAGVSVLITEYPSNPLLRCPDLKRLRELADTYDFALVVDDTIGNFANLDLIQTGMADAICTSLTKLFNGRGDAMAGSVVTIPNTPVGRWMQQDLEREYNSTVCSSDTTVSHQGGLWHGDATAVYANSSDFLERSSRINTTAEGFADWLKGREEVSHIYYPKYIHEHTSNNNANDRNDNYESLLNHSLQERHDHTPGYGGLMAILLHPHICQRTFYDRLDLSKGPSLGTDFTLVCPYTLLAHYHELDFAMSYDVQPNLLRIAVGLEDLDLLKERFEKALGESVLHKKLPIEAGGGGGDSLGGLKKAARGYCTTAGAGGHFPTRRSFGTLSKHTFTPTRVDGGRNRCTSTMTTTMPFSAQYLGGGIGKGVTSEFNMAIMRKKMMGTWSRRAMSSLLLRRPCC